MRLRSPAAGALLLAAGAAQAQWAAPPAFALTAGIVHRRLVERADNGSRLLAETGELLRLHGTASVPLANGGALRASAAAAAGGLDYNGQTQAGVPLATDSAQRDLELGVLWRPLAAARWGEGWLTLHALQQRRQIATTAAAQGVRETSTLVMPGIRWSHAIDAAGWQWRPAVEWRASVQHRLEVGFGGVYDTTRMTGGGRRELVLALDAARSGSPWQWGLAVSRVRQSASDVHPLTRGGAAAGTVRQPRIGIDDVMLRATRAF